MDQKIKESLIYSVMEGFFQMAFLETIPLEGQENIEDTDYSQILVIESYAPEEIMLQFLLPKNSRRKIVENIFADAWVNLSTAEIDDCLLELINVIGGNFFDQFYGSDTTYKMSLPYLYFDGGELEEGEPFYFNVEGDIMKTIVVK